MILHVEIASKYLQNFCRDVLKVFGAIGVGRNDWRGGTRLDVIVVLHCNFLFLFS